MTSGNAAYVTKEKLLGRCRAVLRAGRERLRRFLEMQVEWKAVFPTDAEIVAALRDDLVDLEAARSAARAGDLDRARDLLLTHFRQRSKPRFFVDPADVRPLAVRMAEQNPDWQQQAHRSASEWQRYLYATGEPSRPSDETPDWNHLPLGPGGDTVYRHKAHHFLFAVQLARARVFGPSTRTTLRLLIDSWITATEGRTNSPGYSSPLIAVHRAVALTWTWAFLVGSGEVDPKLEFAIFRIIIADARFVYERLGTSAPNNHLLADGFLIFYLGMLYPELREAEQWRRDGEALFLKELRRQIYEDGTSFEHSVHYHEMVCEMVSAVVILARRNAIKLESWVEERHRRMLEFQAVLGGRGAQSMSIGDAVETHLLPLDGADDVGTASHREILRSLYDAGFPASTRGALGLERAAWLLAGALKRDEQTTDDVVPRMFPDGGFVALPDRALNSSFLFRTGPAPDRLCNSGHMHADFLSVYLQVSGVPMIVDAGTYTYRSRKERWPNGEPSWRAHFLGPAAHNALCIEGQDPLGRGSGDFPSGPLKSRVLAEPLASAAGLTWTEASMVGGTAYGGYVRGVVHVHGAYWLIYDLLPPSAITDNAWLSFQFAPQTSLGTQGKHAVVATTGNAQLLIAMSRGHREAELVRGARDPPIGWVSRRYGDLVPATVLLIPTKAGPKCAATLLQPISRLSTIATLDAQYTNDGAVGMRIECENRRDYVLLSRRAGNQRASLFGIEFDGAALWLRTEGARPTELRALAGRKASSESLGFSMVSRRGARDLKLVFDREAEVRRAREEMDVEVALR
jgi:Heparinase II/III-like protein/Heparinase II/III N-terminus